MIRIGRRRRRSTQTPAGRLSRMNGRNSIVVSRPNSNGADGQDGRGDQRQGELRDRRPEDRDGLGGPQLQEVGVAEQAPARLGHPTTECRSGGGTRRHAGRLGRVGSAACWSKPSPTSPRAGGSRSSIASPRRSSRVPGVYLLDRTSDASHNRSVFTVAGEHEAGRRGARGDGRAGARRDRHGDAHRRAPAHRRRRRHPVRPARRHDDGRLRRDGPGVRPHGSPRAGTCPSTCTRRRRPAPTGCKLADVRRGQYEGLKVEIAHNGRQPDFGPDADAPAAGAVAVGARPFLIAWNINLDSDDVELAKRIARRVRESGGGLPRVQANGFRVEEPERGHPARAQVSMNLLDFRTTPMWRAWEVVGELAAEDGVELAESELIGLAPLAALSTSPTTPTPRPTPRSRRASRRPRPPSSCATSPR